MSDPTNAERQARFRAKRSKEQDALEAELLALRNERGQAKAGADVTRLEAEIAELRNENYAFRVELEALNHVIKTRDGGGLTMAQFRILQQCCHPDNSASPETRAKGIRLLNQLRYVLCNETELPSMDPKKFHISFRKLWERRQRTIKEARTREARAKRAKPARRPARSPRVLTVT